MSWKRGEAYSQDLRDRVLDAGGRVCEVARRFGVSVSYVSKANARYHSTGVRTTRRRGGQHKAILAGREGLVRARIGEVPDITLVELQRWLLETQGIKISIGALSNTLRRIGLSFKKKRLRGRAGAAGGARGA